MAIGAGSGGESVVGTNPSFTVIKDHVLKVTDVCCTYQGAGYLRIRQTDIAGAIMFQRRVAADGDIQADFKTPLELSGGSGSAGTAYVITQEGNFPNSMLLIGTVEGAN
jgi:hypothetical protein